MIETWWEHYWSSMAVGASLINMLGSWLFWRLARQTSRRATEEAGAAVFIHGAVRSMLERLHGDVARMKKQIKELDIDEGDWWKRPDGQE